MRQSSYVLIVPLLVVLMSCASSAPVGNENQGPPFATLRFKTSGCMSCSQCRSTIRQVERGWPLGTLKIGDESTTLEVWKPVPLDVGSIVRDLEAAGIIRFKVHEAEMEVDGGCLDGYFVLSASKQKFPLAMGAAWPRVGTTRRMTAKIMDWEDPKRINVAPLDP